MVILCVTPKCEVSASRIYEFGACGCTSVAVPRMGHFPNLLSPKPSKVGYLTCRKMLSSGSRCIYLLRIYVCALDVVEPNCQEP